MLKDKVLKNEMSFAIRYGARDFKRDFAAAAYQIFLVIIEASENARTDRTENNTVLDKGKFYQSLKKEVLQLINATLDDKALFEKYLMAAISFDSNRIYYIAGSANSKNPRKGFLLGNQGIILKKFVKFLLKYWV